MYLSRNVLSWLLLLLSPTAAATESRVVPAEFLHDQVWVTPSIQGQRLRLFTDTGGGWNALSSSVVERLELPREASEAGELVDWPAFDVGREIPRAPAHFMDGRVAVAAPEQLFGGDGFLGGRWFADGVWEFDYPGRRLLRHDGAYGQAPAANRAALGFQIDSDGRRTTHFPSIDVEIDGEVLPLLYDSGATATTTETSAPVFGVAPGTNIGTCFIEQAVFERWRSRHPEWRVLEAADRKGSQLRRMIEVPQVTIAGHTVGPVWFAEQPAGAFQSYMAGMMDRPTWGALGGSALKYFRVVVDYPSAVAHFFRAAD